MSGYKSFAHFYDRLTGNIDYKQRAEYFDKLITINGGKKEILLDLACGTGSLTEQLSKLGYDVIGVDASAEMLSIAASKGQQGITYLCQDMR
ncbi:MAG TPA: class I SAM-dependent methyltransferase, partial [Oscillospiraceae bacterium]|nr:class I SAM-dependent methyltransferase [Oscillospiraceae bacterium]